MATDARRNAEPDEAAADSTAKAKVRGKLVNRTELAHILGCAMNSIDNFRRAGMPAENHGGQNVRWVFNTADCVDWLRRRDLEDARADQSSTSVDSIKRRSALAVAERREFDLAKVKGEMVELTLIGDFVEEEYGVVRSSSLSLPERAKHKIALLDEPDAIASALKEYVNEILSELSSEAEFLLKVETASKSDEA